MQCGHRSNGAEGAANCPPCLHSDCNGEGGELCAICFTSELEEEACVQLGCGHIFHANCVLQLLQHRWNTLKISFAFMACPSCKQEIQDVGCPEIDSELQILRDLRAQIEKMALAAA